MTLAPVSLAHEALPCRCPRCGEGRIFSGLLTVRAACPACALDLSSENAGDGPAVFVMFPLGALVVGVGAWLELSFEPPIWVHAVVLIPLILVGALVLLRPFKAGLIALQYRHDRLRPRGG